MARQAKHFTAAAIVVVVSGFVVWAGAAPLDVKSDRGRTYRTSGGTVWIQFDNSTLQELGWVFSGGTQNHDVLAGDEMAFDVEPSSTLWIRGIEEAGDTAIGGRAMTSGALLLTGLGERVVIGNFALDLDASGVWTVTSTLAGPDDRVAVFELASARTDSSPADRNLRVVGQFAVTASWADRLGQPGATGIVLGLMTIDLDLRPSDQVIPVEQEAGRISDEMDTKPAGSPDDDGRAAGTIGPDIIVGDLRSVYRFGRVGDISSYAVATDSCNIGDARAAWYASTRAHPVIAQNMYRLKDGRFEQIGMSWVKHGFYAVSQSLCTPCNDPTNGTELGVGCSDPYSAWLNGIQTNMSLVSDVNAHTGNFSYPYIVPPLIDETLDRRLLVRDADIDPDLNDDALYFVEGHYIAADDALAGNNNNNASWRSVFVLEPTANTFTVTPTGSTKRQQPAIHAWKASDPLVELIDVQVPGEGLFILGVRTTDLQNGFYHYEYAVQNLNSDRSCGSFSVAIPCGAVVRNIGFHDVDYHSGETYSLTDWTSTVGGETVTWATEDYGTNENANALRWDTLYNFSFDINVGPGFAPVILGLFKPGQPTEVVARTVAPLPECCDCNENDICDACDIECGEGCEWPCGMSLDCNDNDIPDECEADCDDDGIPDECDTFDDCDGDGIPDCWDECPCSTPPGSCICPETGECCFPFGGCIENYSRVACLEQGGTPDCVETPCRDGCLLGDANDDGDRDLQDFGAMQRCCSGPAGAPTFVTPSSQCLKVFDFDDDTDVDLDDFYEFHSALTGP